jgi:minor extracellular protease Epr
MKKNKMKKVIPFALLVGLMSPTLATNVHATTIQNNNVENVSSQHERVIVTFKEEVKDKKAKEKSVNNAKGKIKQQYKNINSMVVELPNSEIAKLKKDPQVVAVEKDEVVRVSDTYDWGLAKVGATTAWSKGFTGEGVKISVIDTGIATHPDLIVSGGVSTVDYTTSYEDDHSHGTHVAGIIGAERDNGIGTVGVAPDAEIYAVKAMDNMGSGYVSDMIEGIDWSIQNDMDIINMSLGVTSDVYAFHQAVDRAYANGILVVAAAGNHGNATGTGDTVEYPAKYSSVIAVSAVDSALNRASFSATGNTVEVTAPGVDILSTYLGGQYARMSGTSMATPYTAGTIALLKEKYPTASASTIRSYLQKQSKDLGKRGRDTQFGYGLIQAPLK